MKDAFLKSIRDEYPNEQVTRLVFADWCLENESSLENKLRTHLPIIDGLNNIHPNHGSGYGFGSGFGNGNGLGNGYGCGLGSGYRVGYGIGHGVGHGYEYKYQNLTLNMPKLHKNQLIFLPFSFAFCGYVQEHMQPYQFKLTNASIMLYHYSSWYEVANNTNRNISTRKFGTITIGPQFFHSIDWEGDLP